MKVIRKLYLRGDTWYDKSIVGLNNAFDDWILTRYFASRICTTRILVDAKTSLKDRVVALLDSFKVAQPVAIAA